MENNLHFQHKGCSLPVGSRRSWVAPFPGQSFHAACEVVWAKRGLRRHCAVWAALSPLSAQAGLNLSLRKSGLTGPICGSSAPFQRVKPPEGLPRMHCLLVRALCSDCWLEWGPGSRKVLVAANLRLVVGARQGFLCVPENRRQGWNSGAGGGDEASYPVPLSPALRRSCFSPPPALGILDIPLTGVKASLTALKMNEA